MKLVPLGDRVVLKQLEAEEKTTHQTTHYHNKCLTKQEQKSYME